MRTITLAPRDLILQIDAAVFRRPMYRRDPEPIKIFRRAEGAGTLKTDHNIFQSQNQPTAQEVPKPQKARGLPRVKRILITTKVATHAACVTRLASIPFTGKRLWHS